MVSDLATVLLIAAGTLFFIAGTVGLLRFPDLFTRVHAMTKADNVGLGLVVAGLALQTDSWTAIAHLLLIWSLVLVSSAAGAQLLVRDAFRRRAPHWTEQ